MGLGMMKIGVTAAVALLVIGMVFSMAPAIGGTIEGVAVDIADQTLTLALYNETAVGLGTAPIGDVHVYNNSAMTSSYEVPSANLTVSNSAGTITLENENGAAQDTGCADPFGNATYYINYESSSYSANVNSDAIEGGDFFATYGAFVGIVIIGLLGGAVIMMWIRF